MVNFEEHVRAEKQANPTFEAFPKIPRWKRDILISEKVDGTNAQIYIGEDGAMRAGSRNRWITPEADNYGFASWVAAHPELRELGPGRHFGEWYGVGINRGYGLFERRFALFNTSRWNNNHTPPQCCGVVPVLWCGVNNEENIERVLEELRVGGSRISPGFMRPEGIVIFHCASQTMFKRTLEKDEQPKGRDAEPVAGPTAETTAP